MWLNKIETLLAELQSNLIIHRKYRAESRRNKGFVATFLSLSLSLSLFLSGKAILNIISSLSFFSIFIPFLPFCGRAQRHGGRQ
jgi:hypothetical protein